VNRDILTALLRYSPESSALCWLSQHREVFEAELGYPLALSGICAAAFYDLGFNPQMAAYLYLILRLPGAAMHAIEQQGFGWKKFPFFAENIVLKDDPGFMGMPSVKGLDL
jgi:citrate synthase